MKSNEPLSWDEFERVEMVVATIISVSENKKAKKPAYVFELDAGPYGILTSSAQLTYNYTPEDLLSQQVVVVTNFPEKRIAGIKSQCLILGAVESHQHIVIISPERGVKNGTRIG